MKEKKWFIEAVLQTVIAGLLLALLAEFHSWNAGQQSDNRRRLRVEQFLSEPITLACPQVKIDPNEVKAEMSSIRKSIIETTFGDSIAGNDEALLRCQRGIAAANDWERKLLELP